MLRVRCVNGHDVTGVEGFTCPSCAGEVQTVLGTAEEQPTALRPATLVAVGGLVLTLMLLTLVVGPVGQSAFVGGVLISFAALGAALWVACALVALTMVGDREK